MVYPTNGSSDGQSDINIFQHQATLISVGKIYFKNDNKT
jgi:hypothetical protein